MLSRSNRFHGYNSLNFAYRQGSTVREAQLTLKYARNDRRKYFRAAVVISRKVSKKAVVRNRIRRKVYESIRTIAPTIDKPYDLIFSVYGDEVASMGTKEIDGLIKRLLEQARVIPKG